MKNLDDDILVETDLDAREASRRGRQCYYLWQEVEEELGKRHGFRWGSVTLDGKLYEFPCEWVSFKEICSLTRYGMSFHDRIPWVNPDHLFSLSLQAIYQATETYKPGESRFKSYAFRLVKYRFFRDAEVRRTVQSRPIRHYTQVKTAVDKLIAKGRPLPLDPVEVGELALVTTGIASSTMFILALYAPTYEGLFDFAPLATVLSLTPADQAVRADEAATVRDALAGLTADQAEVIRLRYNEDLPLAEIAKCMGRTGAAVRKIHSRALAELRRLTERVLGKVKKPKRQSRTKARQRASRAQGATLPKKRKRKAARVPRS